MKLCSPIGETESLNALKVSDLEYGAAKFILHPPMQGFIFGLILILCGGTIMYFNKVIEETMGRNARAERNLGSTYVMYVLIGFAMVTLGILLWFGLRIASPLS